MIRVLFILLFAVNFACSNDTKNAKLPTTIDHAEDESYGVHPDSLITGLWYLSGIESSKAHHSVDGEAQSLKRKELLRYLQGESDSMVYNFKTDKTLEFNGSYIGTWQFISGGELKIDSSRDTIGSPLSLHDTYRFAKLSPYANGLRARLFNDKREHILDITYALTRHRVK